ncbi:MAG: ABC transporter substrate-binding protein [Actinomycetota bacterium]
MDVIVATSNQEIAVARRATTTVPIVMMFGTAPVELGFVASLARPATNVTGAVVAGPEMGGKMLELLRDILPDASRVGVLWNPDFAGGPAWFKSAGEAAQQLRITLQSVEARTLADLPPAFSTIRTARLDGLLVPVDQVVFEGRRDILSFASQQRLPGVYSLREFVDQGGLVSYAASFTDQIRRCARYVDRILRGAKPADLPVEQPTKFELVINVRTAKALGLTIPPSVLVRVDELIQ